METIWSYLDNMFVNLPRTPEVLRAKEDLAEMMEDKYNELLAEGKMQNEAIGIVISEFGNIQELIDELGIENTAKENTMNKDAAKENIREEVIKGKFTKEEFTKENVKKEDGSGNQSKMRHISDVEADEYLFVVKQSANRIASGVFLCICSPVLLILLSGIQEYIWPISEAAASGAGITVLLCMIACAVGLFITSGMKLDAYEYLKRECFIIDQEYEQSIYNIRESCKKRFTFKIMSGVMLCILSAVPIILTSIFAEYNENEFLSVISVVILLVMVGIAVFLFITGGMEEESYKVILQEKEFSMKKKSRKKIEDIIAALYWPVILVAYLSWSFMSERWEITWVIWPFAGIIFDIVCKIIENAAPEK